jgi:phosphatidylglycerol lysyltransferase
MIRAVRRLPVTTLYLATLLAASIFVAVGGHLGRVLLTTASTGYREVVHDHRIWSPVTSVFVTQNWFELLWILPLAMLSLGFAEERMGSRRLAASGLLSVVAGIGGGLTVQAIGVLGGEMWSRNVQEFDVTDPSVLLAGVLLASTAFLGGIWQARLRVTVLTACAVFLLYSGQPSDLYRLLAALAGLAIGHLFRRSPLRRRWLRSPHHEFRILASMVVAITAVGPVITLFSGRRYGLLAPLGLLMSGASPSGQSIASECDPLSVTSQCLRDLSLQRLDSAGPVVLAILPLALLVVAAIGLARGRRLAIWLTIVLAGLGTYYYGFLPLLGARRIVIPPNLHYWEITLSLCASVLVPLTIAVILFRNRRHFTVRARAGSVATYLTVVGTSLAGLSALYLVGGWFTRAQFSMPVTFADLLADLPERFIPISFLRHEIPEFAPNSLATQILYDWIGPVFWVVVLLGAMSTYFDRGALNYAQGLPLVRALVRRGGGGDLAGWATWKGNSYWFSEDGRASVAYRVLAGVAITTSEPIGDPVSTLAAVEGFARFCDDHGWIPVFYAIHRSIIPSVEKMGWRTMLVAEETVVRLETWTTSGKRWQDIRSSINRAERLGVRASWTTFADLTADWRLQVERISSQWVAAKALPEMGFTLGSIDELRSPDVGLMLASDARGTILGVTSWMPSYRDGAIVGWTLDFMRRSPDGMNGVMEFLIAKSAERFRDSGAEVMSLSTAPFATSLPRPGTAVSMSERFLARVGTSIEPIYGFRSLFEFKRKFQPELHPIYLAYPDALAIPAIVLALVKAYLPMLSLSHGAMALRRRLTRGIPRASRDASWSESESGLVSK